MYIKNKRGQSTVEYVLLMTAVVVVIIAFVSTSKGGFQTQLNSTLNAVTGDMNSEAGQLSTSHDGTPAPTGSGVGTPPYSINVESGV